ncbi:hypothetical protein H0H87_010280 [Tephrocybe sp. NHM501043]|nr:hypothetical protein H0H87_010280 [Tephrocybe sp. NHM501043]
MVAVSAFTYTIDIYPVDTYPVDIWFKELYIFPNRKRRLDMVFVVRMLTAAQRHTAKLVTGSLSTAARDVLNVHSYLFPINLPIDKVLVSTAPLISSNQSTKDLIEVEKSDLRRDGMGLDTVEGAPELKNGIGVGTEEEA